MIYQIRLEFYIGLYLTNRTIHVTVFVTDGNAFEPLYHALVCTVNYKYIKPLLEKMCVTTQNSVRVFRPKCFEITKINK